jgi:hypothetical protein
MPFRVCPGKKIGFSPQLLREFTRVPIAFRWPACADRIKHTKPRSRTKLKHARSSGIYSIELGECSLDLAWGYFSGVVPPVTAMDDFRRFHCSHCGRRLKTPAKSSGTYFTCPTCRVRQRINECDSEFDLNLVDPMSVADKDSIVDGQLPLPDAHNLCLSPEQPDAEPEQRLPDSVSASAVANGNPDYDASLLGNAILWTVIALVSVGVAVVIWIWIVPALVFLIVASRKWYDRVSYKERLHIAPRRAHNVST